MDNFARQSSEHRRIYIEEAAARRDLTPIIIEKYFWVCWTLRRLTNAMQLKGQLTFKGGTSLSKAYGMIYRFSEDIDLTISRTAPIVCEVNSPMDDGISQKERGRRTGKLKEAAQKYVNSHVMPILIEEIKIALGTGDGWSVEIDIEDPDQQTLLFHYPKATGFGSETGRNDDEEINPYIKPRIKLEFGARGDTEPSELKRIRPYLAEDDLFPDELPDALCELETLGVIRTFWEKITILHALHYNDKFRDGMSRHYYDSLMLFRSGVADQALAHPELLKLVVRNKTLMFRDGTAQYDKAVLGTLRTVPSEAIIVNLKQDYVAMEEMFMHSPPSFSDLMAGIEELEVILNRSRSHAERGNER